MTSLIDSFAALPQPSVPGAYSVDEERMNCRIGKSFDGHPAVLVSLTNPNGSKVPRRLANLSYRPASAVEIRTGSGVHAADLAIVELHTSERRLMGYFFRVVAEGLMPEARSGDERRFEDALDAVITVFKALQRPGTRTVQGLWAELAMLAYAEETQAALSSWHSNSRALHDFANGAVRVEVKSTTLGMREHAFLLDQLRTGAVGQIFVASFLLSPSSGGASVFDLLRLISNKLARAEAIRRLETIVADSLGNSFEEVEDHRFDLDAARVSLLLYRAEDVPTCAPPPPEVRDVSFTADLSSAKPLDLHEARKLSPELRALLPSV